MIDTQAIRNKVLDLAMQGQLTEQQTDDVYVEKLYEDIIKSKDQILQKRKGRKDNNIKEIGNDTPFDIPAHWKWIRFGDVGLFKKGPFGSALTKSMFVPKNDNAVKVYEQQHAIKKDANLGTYYITKEYFDEKMAGFEVQPGDIIVSCAGTIGETYILPENIEQGIINQALMRITLAEGIDKRFFLYYFDSNLKRNAQEESNGSAIKNIPPFDVMKNWYFPLTSMEEQERIVERIECIFKKLDIIDDLQQQYVFNQEVLKSKLIDAAIQGKLTEQLPEDGTAEELHKQVQKETQILIKEGKFKKKKALPDLNDEDYPFEIPKTWKWIHLGDLISIESGKGLTAAEMIPGEVPVYGGNGITGYHDNGFVPEGTVVIGRVGYYCGSVHVTQTVSWVTDNAFITAYPENSIDKWYLVYVLRKMRLGQNNNGSAQPVVSGKKIYPLPFPLPPLSEQKRIADVFKAIIPLCENAKQ